MAKITFKNRAVSDTFDNLGVLEWFECDWKGDVELYLKINDFEALCMTDHMTYTIEDDFSVCLIDDSRIEIIVRDLL